MVFGEADGIPSAEFGEPGAELLDTDLEPTLAGEEIERMRIEAKVPAWARRSTTRSSPPRPASTRRTSRSRRAAIPGQEPVARLRHRGKVNRSLRVLEVESAEPGDEIREGDKVVGRVTSAVSGKALGYVRVEVSAGAELAVGETRKTARLLGA